MPKISASIGLAAILILSWAVSQPERAEGTSTGPLYMVLIDRHASNASQMNRDLTESFVGLLSTLREGQRLGYMTAESGEALIGPEVAGSPEYRSAHRDVVNRLRDGSPIPAADLTAAILDAHEAMRFADAAEGSTLYVVSGGESGGENASNAIAEFKANGWNIVGISIGEPSSGAEEFLNAAADGTGGDVFPLGAPSHLKAVADSILRADAKGTLFEIGQDDLATNEVFTASLDIAPSTTETSLVFFKQGDTGSLSLKNPSGFAASEGDRALSNVVETPYVVVWTLVDPVPGRWSVDVRGKEGFISAWHYPKDRLSLQVVSFDTVPNNQRFDLVAYIADGNERVSVPGTEIHATISDAAGNVSTHTLNDNGEFGDSVANDNYYSTTVPQLGAEGEYQLELSLYWPEHDHSISTRQQVVAQIFPSLNVEITAADGIVPGERTKVATVQVHVDGQPYAIPTEQLTVQVLSNDDGGVLEVVPQKLLNTEHASDFDVMFTPSGEALHTLQVQLDMEYASRGYTYTADSFVLESAIPPVVIEEPPAPVAPPPAPAPAPPPPALVAPVAPPIEPEPDFSVPQTLVYGLIAVAAAAVVGGVMYIGYAMSRPRPYGMLYDDDGNLLVDLAEMNRTGNTAIRLKNVVRGEELGIPELQGLSFHFSSSHVDIRSLQTEPSIRINNRPLIEGEQMRAADQSWIGTQGKLFSLHLVPVKDVVAMQSELELGEQGATPSVGGDD